MRMRMRMHTAHAPCTLHAGHRSPHTAHRTPLTAHRTPLTAHIHWMHGNSTELAPPLPQLCTASASHLHGICR